MLGYFEHIKPYISYNFENIMIEESVHVRFDDKVWQ